MATFYRGKVVLIDSEIAAGSTFNAGGPRIENLGAPSAADDACSLAKLEEEVPPTSKYEHGTGLNGGGFLTISSGDATLFDVAASTGIITNPATGSTTAVSWDASTGHGGSYGGEGGAGSVGVHRFGRVDADGQRGAGPFRHVAPRRAVGRVVSVATPPRNF